MPFDGRNAVMFVQLMTGLAETFGRETSKTLLSGYEMALDDLPIDDVARGVRRAIRECKFMPSGSELREMCGVVPLAHRAVVAWGCVKQAVASHGAYASIDFDDPAINAAVRNLGGWERVCDTPPGDDFDKWLRAAFEKVYVAFCRNGFSAELARPLIGICDRQNSAEGFPAHVEAPRLVSTGLKRLAIYPPADERVRLGLSPMTDVLKSAESV